MNYDKAVSQLNEADYTLPKEAMHWIIDNWASVSDKFITMLDNYAEGKEQSEKNARVLFFVLHIMGEVREARAFSSICKLARDTKSIEDVLDDGITVTLPAILIGTYDGDLACLNKLIEDEKADEFTSTAGLEVYMSLVEAGQVSRESAEQYLLSLYDILSSRAGSFIWTAWALAIARLGAEEHSPLVQKAFSQGYIEESCLSYEDYRETLLEARLDPSPPNQAAGINSGALGSAIEELSKWYAFSPKRREDEKKYSKLRVPEFDPEEFGPFGAIPGGQTTVYNPDRFVGRNDPCPCGSGQKYKKCCLN